MRTFIGVLISAMIFCRACAALASAPSQSYVVGLAPGGAALDLSPTNAAGEVLLSAVTNSAGGIRIHRFLPPDHDWRFRIGSKWYGMTYYGTKAPARSQGTWIMASGHSLRLPVHPYALVSALGVLLLIPTIAGWRWATRGGSTKSLE